ncbi:MAG: amidohydrolase family protein [Methanocorpusculum sp.]|nr:amidohydrolase family protein [Methanocorpusculum sp.]
MKRSKALAIEEQSISGLAFTGREYTPENVELTVQNGIITEIIPARKEPRAYILPAFFNAHTHIGDTIAMDTPIDRPLADLVAPPNGLKHQILRATPSAVLTEAMRSTIHFMQSTGTRGFADFREGGTAGVEALLRAGNPEMQMVILGRDGGELAPGAAGLGLSNAHGRRDEDEAVACARRAGKLIAVHAGEAGTKDIEPAFALEPDLIIHAAQFSDADIRRAADEDIAVAVCPRSNWLLGAAGSAARPPVKKLLDAGVRVYLGTDNAMFVPPDMYQECAFLMTVYKVSAENALRMATAGFALADSSSEITIGSRAYLTVAPIPEFLHWSRHPLATLLTRRNVI